MYRKAEIIQTMCSFYLRERRKNLKAQAIKDLFTGKSFPCEAVAPADKEYWKLLNESHQELEQFKSKLSPEDGERLEEIINKRQDALHFEISEAFTQGYALGVQLTAEAFLFNQAHKEEFND